MALNCFEVRRPDGRGDLLVIYQTDFLAHLDSRLVIPLLNLETRDDIIPVARLNPVFSLEDGRYVLWTQSALSVDVRKLGSYYGSLEHERDAIRDAFDFLTTGF